jgi:two-component system CheB/CheR fusion protein
MAENGRWLLMRILPYRTKENVIDGVVITFIDITDRKWALEQMRAAKIFAERIVETVRVPLLILGSNLEVISANARFYRVFRTTRGETENKRIYDLGNGQWNIRRLRELLEQIVPNGDPVDDFEVEHDFPGIGFKKMSLSANLVAGESEIPEMIILSIEDITG